jgi:hypothetical protein
MKQTSIYNKPVWCWMAASDTRNLLGLQISEATQTCMKTLKDSVKKNIINTDPCNYHLVYFCQINPKTNQVINAIPFQEALRINKLNQL